ncbi:thermonuclease family protein [Chroococcidiopsis thermalis]|uniref:Nuclease (SNase domain-containing protein) n=1 Tax=Chroococcidiopsis thermalis (strain PCC 7203) TaxID=251229 RepID=K9U9C4_CHRTP|nr:thermonuclease family protein [Chroococcidiopsis thermalis]AFY90839.1 nuclease (SNase domain-containing protein) [Chroococcidiopsis thermalis PCC 7203]
MQLIRKLLPYLFTIIFILFLTGCQPRYGAAAYSVKRVSDGDTIRVVNAKGDEFTVRFACVDAPEIPHSVKERASQSRVDVDQFKWGLQAQQRLQKLIHQGGDRVNLTITDSDRYGRKVSEVRLGDGTLVQEVMAREGLVLVYTPYLKNCPSAAVVERAATQAQAQRRGVWNDAQFVAPWKYRSAKK